MVFKPTEINQIHSLAQLQVDDSENLHRHGCDYADFAFLIRHTWLLCEKIIRRLDDCIELNKNKTKKRQKTKNCFGCCNQVIV